MTDLDRIRTALLAEQTALDEVVSGLSPDRLALGTPSPGWSILDQVAHLAYFDDTAALAIEDVEAFRAAEKVMRSFPTVDEATLRRDESPDARLAAWRANRVRLARACATLADTDRVVWYGPPMGARSFVSARLMECWAHGEDVRDTVGAPPSDTDRLREIATIGVNTRKWSYANRGLVMPDRAVRVELTARSGDRWAFGPQGAADVVAGTALDFCHVVTQRRHLGDTALVVTGAAARGWMEIAQAFAGAPTMRPRAGGTP
ncbi:TIGR03084 family metal-binding protein [Pseudofrankia inefficax]|uniref:Mycothiol-dependent maleylpyruvate isomerase metal-binding domain-containing protein n=1 Tax=Pseudofrankia inefficax (strain DSM 45817 / CECT 9037 / DDB 130130 / EuI1c) TaxID=298654 RepID=E3J926_PSEI1|nr:TIGR03084 family metal-binding protein [Pseudofrankia inefficax]ADP80905.1 hypothetical protein FraEuI1c_2879 [Pseudofrankia inefficax]